MALGKNEKANKTVSIRKIGSNDSNEVDLKSALKEIIQENKIN